MLQKNLKKLVLRRLHIVDLDGAKKGRIVNIHVLENSCFSKPN